MLKADAEQDPKSSTEEGRREVSRTPHHKTSEGRPGFEEEHGQALDESCLAKFRAVVKAEFIQVFHTHL